MPSGANRSRAAIAASIARRDRSGVVRIGAHGDVARRLVHARGGRRRRPASRTPSPRRSASRSPRTATGRRRPPRPGRGGRAPRPRRTRAGARVDRRAQAGSPQPSPPATASRMLALEQAMCVGERLQVLARLEGGDGEDVGRAELGGPSLRREHVLDARRGNANARGVDAEQLGHVGARERRVDEDHVARPGGVRVLAPVHGLASAWSSTPGSASGRDRESRSRGRRPAAAGTSSR